MPAEKIKDVEKMIAKVMKKKEITRNEAIDYMLVVATGRLAALWRYDESVPEGKKNKGILGLTGRKKRAPKTPKIVIPDASVVAPKPEKPAKKRKPKAKANPPKDDRQIEIGEAIAE